MLLRHTLLYLPAQIVGPLFQLIAMIVWTHVVDEHTLGVITLVTATHELLQIAFLAWWSQYALRFFGRYQDEGEALRFYRTENAVLLVSVILQSIIVIAILLLVIAPDASDRTSRRNRRLCDHAYAQSLYRRARPRSSPDLGLFDPADRRARRRIYRRPGLDQVDRSIGRMAACGLRPRPACRGHHRAAENRLWPPLLAARSRNRRSCAALRHSAHHRRRARLGRPQCIALHCQRDVGSGRGGTVRRRLRSRSARRRGRRHAGYGRRLSARGQEHGAKWKQGRDAPARRQRRAADRNPGPQHHRHFHAARGDRASADRRPIPAGDACGASAVGAGRLDSQRSRAFRRSGFSAAQPHPADDRRRRHRCSGDRRAEPHLYSTTGDWSVLPAQPFWRQLPPRSSALQSDFRDLA